MQTVTFAREYRHRIDDLRTAIYPAGAQLCVTEVVARAARSAGAIEEEVKDDEQRPAEGN